MIFACGGHEEAVSARRVHEFEGADMTFAHGDTRSAKLKIRDDQPLGMALVWHKLITNFVALF